MGNVILGVVLGLLAGLLLCCFCFLIKGEVYNDILENVLSVVAVGLLVISTIVGGYIGASCTKHGYESYIVTYPITKELIESSVTNDSIGGLERAQLVQQVVSENKTLTNYQYSCQQWYGFLIPDEILELEPINLGGSND